MEGIYIAPSTEDYDGRNKIKDVIREYEGYTSYLSDVDLKREYESIRSDWLSCPTIKNVRMFKIAKERMFERGLLAAQTQAYEQTGPELYK